MRLAGKSTLITGGGSGIGRATALAFAAEGARVAILDLQPAETVALIDGALGIAVDLTDAAAVEAAFAQVEHAFGGLHAMFNGVGGSGRRWGDGPVAECTEEGWQRTLDLNLTTIFLGCKYGVPTLLRAGGGALVNLSSVLGLVGGDEDFATHAYAASKGAIISLTRSIASTYAPQGLRANVICPGLIATPMSRRAQESEHIRERLAALQPLTADFGRPEDVAAAAVYLASDEARFVTGVVLPVDGGWTMR